MTFRFYGEPQEDKRLRQMILISAVLHAVVIMWVVVSAYLNRSTQPRAVAFTVDLVNPAALGTNVPGGGPGGAPHQKTEPVTPLKPPVLPPEPKQEAKLQVAKREEPKPPLVQQKDAVKTPAPEKSVEKTPVKPEPERVKSEEKKLETKKIEPKPEPPKVVKTEEPKPEAKKVEPPLETKPEQKKTGVKPEVEKVKPGKVEEKKPEPPQPESQPHRIEAKAEKPEAKPEKTETKPQAEKPPVKTTEEKLTSTENPPPDERERQIAAALERVKSRVQSQESVARDNPEFSEEAKGSGPTTKGEAVGEGGGGAVRGLEFILYTQRLQRRVQESWIVTEKKPGLTASVSFKIQPDGEVQDVELMKSSGDGAFDQSVLRAVRKAAPFPPPPQSYAQEFATQKIVMNFGGEGRVN